MLIFLFALSACTKNEIHNTDTQVGISRVTYFPVLALKGTDYMTVALGSNFSDPGVTATEGGKTISYTTSGSVNTNTAGVYTLTYTAINKDGFPASITRVVIVYSTDDTAVGNDLSGSYMRSSNGVIATWMKLAPGVYKVINPGGAVSGGSLVVVAFNQTGYSIKIPSQRSSDGNISSSSNETYTAGSPSKYSWVFLNPGYGTSLRTFIKQ
jgi:hypothetical protein